MSEDIHNAKPSNSKSHLKQRSIPSEVTVFCIRVFVAALLILLSYLISFPWYVALILKVVAYICCVGNIFVSYIKELCHHKLLSEKLLYFFITLLAVCVARFIMASVSALLFEVGSGLFEYSEKKLSSRINARISEIESKDETAGNIKSNRLKNVTTDISDGEFLTYYKISNVRDVIFLITSITALVLCFIVPLFSGMHFTKWVLRGISVAAIGAVWHISNSAILLHLDAVATSFSKGIYLKNADTLSTVSSISSVIFNKSGILTDGVYRITNVEPVRISKTELMSLAAYAESDSEHPLARLIVNYPGVNIDSSRISQHLERRGIGSMVQIDGGQIIAVGSIELMEKIGVKGDYEATENTSVYVAVGSTYVGRIDFEDNVKETASTCVERLKKDDVANIALITGDSTLSANKISREVGITELYADCLPEDKVSRLQYIKDTREKDDYLAVIGDGVSDNELLEMGDQSMVLGFLSDAQTFREEADVVLDSNDPILVSDIIGLAKSLKKTIRLEVLVVVIIDALLAALSFLDAVSVWMVIPVEFILQAIPLLTLAYKRSK